MMVHNWNVILKYSKYIALIFEAHGTSGDRRPVHRSAHRAMASSHWAPNALALMAALYATTSSAFRLEIVEYKTTAVTIAVPKEWDLHLFCGTPANDWKLIIQYPPKILQWFDNDGIVFENVWNQWLLHLLWFCFIVILSSRSLKLPAVKEQHLQNDLSGMKRAPAPFATRVHSALLWWGY